MESAWHHFMDEHQKAMAPVPDNGAEYEPDEEPLPTVGFWMIVSMNGALAVGLLAAFFAL